MLHLELRETESIVSTILFQTFLSLRLIPYLCVSFTDQETDSFNLENVTLSSINLAKYF